MKVYRYLSETELKLILEGQTNKLGHSFISTRFCKKRVNTFIYKKGVKYMHFFKHKKDIEKIKPILLSRHKDEKFYLCTFEINPVVLFFSAGKGFYEPSGYDLGFYAATEYAVQAKRFKPEWLVSYELDEHPEVEQNKKSVLDL